MKDELPEYPGRHAIRVHAPEPNRDCIRRLEFLLEGARRGAVIGVLGIALTPNNEYSEFEGGDTGGTVRLLGQVRILQMSIEARIPVLDGGEINQEALDPEPEED